MTDLKLYTLVVPRDSQSALSAQLQQQLATSGALGVDGGIVEQISGEPGTQTIDGVYTDQYASKMADELEELAQASGFDELPLTGLDTQTSRDGYYVLENADVDQVQPHTDRVQEYNLQLTKKGTKNDFWRTVETNRQQVDHDWGTDLTAEVGVPAAASKVQWFNPEDGTRTQASAASTRSAELGDVDIYDLDAGESAVGTSNPTLLYEIAYGAEENVDVRIYDTLGNPAKLDADGHLQWQKLFSTQHDFDTEILLDNGLLRLRLDESAGTLTAEEWDATNEQWVTVTGMSASDQPSTVTLFDIDVTEIGMVRDQAQLTFDVDGSLFALDAMLAMGAETALFSIPTNETGPIPTPLHDWLSPIAATTIVDPQPSKTLISRNEVRR